MIIRPETFEDFGLIYDFVQEAFATAEVAEGTEQDFVDRLRAGSGYIPELALVAEEEGAIVGYVMLTRCELMTKSKTLSVLLLAPLAVKLERRQRGLGARLTKEALGRARMLGFKAVFLVGNPAYYSRFGFARADTFGISSKASIPPQFVLALELTPGALAGAEGVINIA